MADVYYNEFDPFAAAWLRSLILDGQIPAGDVDERSIEDLSADDLDGYTQCHFFAGIGGWGYALQLAGWGGQSGPAPVPASRFRMRDSDRAKQMPATFGLFGDHSSKSAILQRSLESKLRAALDVNGSPEFVLTWKTWDMASGEPICALRALGRHTSDNGFGSWPTPTTADDNQDMEKRAKRGKQWGFGPALSLGTAARMTGWPTPRAEDSESAGAHRSVPDTLTSAARVAGWDTPTSRDHKDTGDMTNVEVNSLLGRQVASWATPNAGDAKAGQSVGRKQTSLGQHAMLTAHGISMESSLAETISKGALNPAFSLWLMGYPASWQMSHPTWRPWSRWQEFLGGPLREPENTDSPHSGARVTRSSRKSRQSS